MPPQAAWCDSIRPSAGHRRLYGSNDKTKDFYAEGLTEQKAHLRADGRGQWLFDAEILTREGTSSDLQKALEGKLTADAKTIAFNYDRKRLEMREGVAIAGPTQTINADEMVQDDTAKFFLLHGNVLVKPDPDNELRAAQIYVDTENDVYTFVGLVQGNIRTTRFRHCSRKTVEGATPGAAGGAAGNVTPAAGLFTARDQAACPDGPWGRSAAHLMSRRTGSPSPRRTMIPGPMSLRRSASTRQLLLECRSVQFRPA